MATRQNPKSSRPVQSENATEISQSGSSADSQATPTTSGAIAEESVLAASTGDLPTGDDKLGFEPYVQALAEFLLNPSTHGPLTVSVEGEWGSGKSSFMMQLQERLTHIADAPGRIRPLRKPLTVQAQEPHTPSSNRELGSGAEVIAVKLPVWS